MTKCIACDNIEYFREFLKKCEYSKLWSNDWIIFNIEDYIDSNKKKFFRIEIYHTKDSNYSVGYRYFTIKNVTFNDINQLIRMKKLKKLKIC